MTKQDLQKELQAKVKPGVKPSDLKKLKRSKSDGDISVPTAPPLPQSIPLSKSSSQPTFSDDKYPYTTLISQSQEIEQLKKENGAKSTTISLLRKKIGDLQSELSALENKAGKLEKENQERGSQNDALLIQLAETMEELNSLKETPTAELDQALLARHQNLKDWFTQYNQKKELEKELKENIDEASNELISQDQTINTLRTKISQLKLANQSLEKDLALTSKLAQLRKDPLPSPINNPWIPSTLTFLLIGTLLWLTIR